MRQPLEQMASLLQEQNELLTGLLEVMRELRAVIVSADTKRFDSAIRQIPKSRRKLSAVEKQLRDLLPTVTAQLGLEESKTTLGGIINCVEPEAYSVLQPLKDRLTEGFHELIGLSIENQEYLDEHLDYSEAVLNLLVQEEDPLNNFYGDDGNATPEQKKSASIFDRNA